MEEMKKTIVVPEGVDVAVDGLKVTVKGPRGELERNFEDPKYASLLTITLDKDRLTVSVKKKRKKMKAIMGTVAAHIRNMLQGVVHGYRYNLKVVYAHFPITVSVEGDRVIIKNFLGEKSERSSKVIGNTKVIVKGQDISVEGIDKEAVSQTAANIENAARVTGKDRRVFSDGIFITSKAEGLDEEEKMEKAQGAPEQSEKEEERKG